METNPYVFKSLVQIYEEYLNLMIHRVKGYKVLILDDETKTIISLIFSHSYILEKEIFLTLNFNDSNIFEDATNGSGKNDKFDFKNYKIKNLKHLKAIFLLRPTHTNILKLMKELRRPIFLEYYLFFTNVLSDKYTEKLAKADEFEVVKNIMEYYIDAYVLHDNLFSLNIDYTSFFYKNDHNNYLSVGDRGRNRRRKKKGPFLKNTPGMHWTDGNYNLGDDGKIYDKLTIDEFEEIGEGNMDSFSNGQFQNNNDYNVNTIVDDDVANYSNFDLFENQVVQRIVDGVFSLLCSVKQVPDIIYNRKSPICKHIIDLLKIKMLRNESVFSGVLDSYERYNGEVQRHIKMASQQGEHSNYQFNSIIGNQPPNMGTEGNCCYMLILDRREDPITPLLTQWTYQAMLHELIGIENNKINMGINPEESQIVMSCIYDDFYNEHLFDNFGDLGKAVKTYVDVYQEETSRKSNLESIDDIQKFIEIYPNYKKLSGNVTKHVNILHKFSEIVEKRQLFYMSELEQSIAIYDKKSEHFKQVIETIRNGMYSNYDVLRLSLLYSLKYEDEEEVEMIKTELTKRNIDKDQVLLIDALLMYANEEARNNQLFKEQTFLDFAKTTITRTIKGTSNVFTLHKSYIYYLIEDLLKSKLDSQTYTTTNLLNIEPNVNKRVNSMIIFFIGGATYEEYRDLQYLSKRYNISFLLGATQIHNSQSFLADALQLVKD
ncbi:vacuolar protein sorting-associated protein 45, putative [Plasmodium knowlesi strain H]|uniref:Vacuolar protein sorting-associated protein 45, putative n=3 Tax=Plasmodium knowlesi TaxID=5850 RepID=A0A5K1VDV4_PLAKH|nr:vacuolar protein sorting-associated protein 45, putative [Plasmodium knowlesi strain H]OTN66695.1 putative Vacuolar protein sorting-associated protein 45 [Plasmodium knowlesi]CAA9986685.1 vacuolar protein sorting-associated protein 45, putative [Plasmodium knowlesi strain H]SBO23496.1 vacuolar protein sorting-associated protein 45, putative [Plasmodium knowlesi strain H]SBO24975.1 vacuolar protein sorting-associated protein 45, putative [Plasmodium knowlesi strain H]VVS76159.1 vacuolar prot|eukprot:XP_002257871.1 Vacuolar protein-sorting protein VPS45,putative [Plasmodium knowlesi strain H]